MKKAIYFGVGALIVLGVISFFVFSEPATTSTGGSGGVSIDLNYDNFEEEFVKSSLVKDLPDDISIALEFYNFDSGDREIEKSFILRKNEVVEGSLDDAEVVMLIHSKYLEEWTNRNFCSVMKKANNNGDMGYETDLGSVELAWKFKGLTKYKDCFGI